MPKSITSIGDRAFFGCRRLIIAPLHNSVTSIGSYAFSGCSALTDVIIPSSVISIGNYAFANCSNLTSVVFEGDASDFKLGAVGMASLFMGTHNDFHLYYFADAIGFTSPTWHGYSSVSLGTRGGPFIVSNTNDFGAGSLRYAIDLAPYSSATITFAAHLADQSILLTSGPIEIDKNLTIDTEGKSVTVDGNSIDRIFIFHPGTTNRIEGLSLVNGYAGAGGAILLEKAVLHLSHVTMTNNFAAFGGGCIYCTGATLTVSQSTFSENQASFGSVVGTGSVTLTVNSSTFSNNISGYGVVGYGGADMVVNNSTFTGNSGFGEGCITFDQGGRIQTFNNCTITGNDTTRTYGQLLYAEDGNITLNNTIAAGNNGGNVISAALGVVYKGHNITSGDPLLSPLGDYGGPTQTMPPLPGSPAIDGGMNSSVSFTADQRGLPRVLSIGLAEAQIDIGAVEWNGWVDDASKNDNVSMLSYFHGVDLDDPRGLIGLQALEIYDATRVATWFLRNLQADGSVTGKVSWSTDLLTWHESGSNVNGNIITMSMRDPETDPADPSGSARARIWVDADIQGQVPSVLFLRLEVDQLKL